MVKDVTIPARLMVCEVCSYEWISTLAPPRMPTHCMNIACRSREWNGKKQRKAIQSKPKIVLPKVVRVRGGHDEE